MEGDIIKLKIRVNGEVLVLKVKGTLEVSKLGQYLFEKKYIPSKVNLKSLIYKNSSGSSLGPSSKILDIQELNGNR
jgi:hypothetical protein